MGMGLLKPIFAAEARLQALAYDDEEIKAKIAADVKSAPVVVYTYSLSPFCTEAIKLLDALGAEYKEIQLAPEWFLMLGENAAKRAELGSLYGRTSMPHIFVGGESIGGLMDGPGLVPFKPQFPLHAPHPSNSCNYCAHLKASNTQSLPFLVVLQHVFSLSCQSLFYYQKVGWLKHLLLARAGLLTCLPACVRVCLLLCLANSLFAYFSHFF